MMHVYKVVCVKVKAEPLQVQDYTNWSELGTEGVRAFCVPLMIYARCCVKTGEPRSQRCISAAAGGQSLIT